LVFNQKYLVTELELSTCLTSHTRTSAGWLQAGQVAASSSSISPGWQLPADRGLQMPPASLRSRQRPHCSENKHSTWRHEFLGCGSENLE